MSRKNNLVITKDGYDLLARTMNGEKLNFTKVVLAKDHGRDITGNIQSVAAKQGTVDICVLINNRGLNRTLQIDDILVYAQTRGTLTSSDEIVFAEVHLDYPDILLPESDGYDEIEYTFVFRIATDKRPSETVVVQRGAELTRTEIERIISSEVETLGTKLDREINREISNLPSQRDVRKEIRQTARQSKWYTRVRIGQLKRSLRRTERKLERKIRRGGGSNISRDGLLSDIPIIGGIFGERNSDFEEIGYHLYTSINANSLLLPSPSRRESRMIERFLTDERARRKDWRQFKRRIDHRFIFSLTNRIKFMLSRPWRSSAVGLVLAAQPLLVIPLSIITTIIAIILSIIMFIPGVIGAIITSIIYIIAFSILVIIIGILTVIGSGLMLLDILWIGATGLVYLIVFAPISWIANAIPWLLNAGIALVAIVGIIVTIIGIILAIILIIPTLGIGSFIIAIINAIIVAILAVIAAVLFILAIISWVVLIPFTILNFVMPLAAFIIVGIGIIAAIIAAAIVIVLGIIPFLLAIGFLIPLAFIFIPTIVSIISIIIAIIGLFFLFFSLFYRSIVIARNVIRPDILTRRLSRGRARLWRIR